MSQRVQSGRLRRVLIALVLFLGISALAGSFISQKVDAQSASDEPVLRDSLHAFTDVYAIVEQNYADHLDADHVDKAIYDGAIPGMLHTLDPHSNFYDPKAFANMREEQHGRYYGVGMQIQPMPDKQGTLHIIVFAPFEGTPAYRAGIHPGDTSSPPSTANPLTASTTLVHGDPAGFSAAVANLLKGPRGTHVSVTMTREGSDKPLVFDLVRDEIPHPSVDLAYLLQPGIGYIRILNFSVSETTGREVGDALAKFGDLKRPRPRPSAATPAVSSTRPSR